MGTKPGHYHTNETQTFVEALVEAEHASNCERGRAVASRAPHRRTRLVPEALSIRINPGDPEKGERSSLFRVLARTPFNSCVRPS